MENIRKYKNMRNELLILGESLKEDFKALGADYSNMRIFEKETLYLSVCVNEFTEFYEYLLNPALYPDVSYSDSYNKHEFFPKKIKGEEKRTKKPFKNDFIENVKEKEISEDSGAVIEKSESIKNKKEIELRDVEKFKHNESADFRESITSGGKKENSSEKSILESEKKRKEALEADYKHNREVAEEKREPKPKRAKSFQELASILESEFKEDTKEISKREITRDIEPSSEPEKDKKEALEADYEINKDFIEEEKSKTYSFKEAENKPTQENKEGGAEEKSGAAGLKTIQELSELESEKRRKEALEADYKHNNREAAEEKIERKPKSIKSFQELASILESEFKEDTKEISKRALTRNIEISSETKGLKDISKIKDNRKIFGNNRNIIEDFEESNSISEHELIENITAENKKKNSSEESTSEREENLKEALETEKNISGLKTLQELAATLESDWSGISNPKLNPNIEKEVLESNYKRKRNFTEQKITDAADTSELELIRNIKSGDIDEIRYDKAGLEISGGNLSELKELAKAYSMDWGDNENTAGRKSEIDISEVIDVITDEITREYKRFYGEL